MRDEYARAWNVTDIFSGIKNGVQTGHDHFAVDVDRDGLRDRILQFFDPQTTDTELHDRYGLRDKAGWNLSRERARAFSEGINEDLFVKYFYRPFDLRWVYYSKRVLKRPVDELMKHLTLPNLALVTCRQQTETGFRHVFTTNHVGDGNAISLKSREWNSYCPLYTYAIPLDGQPLMFPHEPGLRQHNLDGHFTETVSNKLILDFVCDGKGDMEGTFGPEDVFHSPTYRERYAEFLKIDFPRLPLTSDLGLFRALAEKGEELVALHLMESPALDHPIVKFPVKGSSVVEKVRYAEPAEGRPGLVYINKTQYFEGVQPEVWEFHIGGYQVLEKWLKDRKGRTLSYDDVTHYGRIVVALKETIRLMGEIDELIPLWPIE
jgi:predicted helicase